MNGELNLTEEQKRKVLQNQSLNMNKENNTNVKKTQSASSGKWVSLSENKEEQDEAMQNKK